MELIAIVGLLIAGGVGIKAMRTRARRRELLAKYGDEEVVNLIMKQQMWQGMSVEHLTDSLGRPADIDEKLYKTKTVHTYKYHRAGTNRFRTRVKLENGIVVGWDLK